MVRVQSNSKFNEDEALLFSIIASIARLIIKKPFYNYIARYRRYTNPYRFHENNIKTVMNIARDLPSGQGLAQLAIDAQEIIDNKKNDA